MKYNRTETRTFVSAQPEWYVVFLLGDDIDPRDAVVDITVDDFVLEPIIAWTVMHIQGDYDPNHPDHPNPGERWSLVQVIPITINGEPEGDNWAIKRPDGDYDFEGISCDEAGLLRTWNASRARAAKARGIELGEGDHAKTNGDGDSVDDNA